MIGGFPKADGESYADFFEPVDGQVAFPGWEPFAGPDSDDLDDEMKAEVERHGGARCREAVTSGPSASPTSGAARSPS